MKVVPIIFFSQTDVIGLIFNESLRACFGKKKDGSFVNLFWKVDAEKSCQDPERRRYQAEMGLNFSSDREILLEAQAYQN
jgi:hypothetical protein